MKSGKIAIVGMSCCFPKANSPMKFWSNIKQGVDAISDFPLEQRWGKDLFRPKDAPSMRYTYCKKGGVIDYDILIDSIKYKIPPKSIREIDPDHLLTLKLCEEALKDAGMKKDIEMGKKLDCGVIIGRSAHVGPSVFKFIEMTKLLPKMINILKNSVKNIDNETINKFEKLFLAELDIDFSSSKGVSLIGNLVASRVSEKYNMVGASYIIDGACASSLLAIENSITHLLNGNCNMMLAGGVYFPANYFFWLGFSYLTALSKNQKIRPFDKLADGLLIGEGGGIIALKRLEDALSDGDRIYSVIEAISSNSNGKTGGILAPSGEAQVSLYQESWKKSGKDIEELDYMECHGTGMALGDQIEIASMQKFFEDSLKRNTPVGSIKSMIGHTISAAGIASVIKVSMALNEKIIPPSLHCENPIDAFNGSKLFVPNKTAAFTSKMSMTAGVNAFGFGGINSHLIISSGEEYSKVLPKKLISAENSFVNTDDFITISRSSTKELEEALVKKEFTVREGSARLAILNPTEERIEEALAIVKKGLDWKGGYNDIFFSPKGILNDYSSKVAFLFPGLSMFLPPDNELLLKINNNYRYWEERDKSLGKESIMAIKSILVNYSIFKMVEDKGIYPDGVGGYSLGDWIATMASEMVLEDQLTGIIYELSASKDKFNAVQDDYTFIYVTCGVETLNKWIESHSIHIALDNSPNSSVVCVEKKDVLSFFDKLKENKILHYNLGFNLVSHTSFNKELMNGVKPIIDKINIKKPRYDTWVSTTANIYPSNISEVKKVLYEGMFTQVKFNEMILRMYNEGYRVFVQMGIGGLSGYVSDTLKGKAFVTMDAASRTKDTESMIKRVALRLFVEGKNPDIYSSFSSIKNGDLIQTSTISLQSILNEKTDTEISIDLKSNPKNSLILPEIEETINNNFGELIQENLSNYYKAQSMVLSMLPKSKLVEKQNLDFSSQSPAVEKVDEKQKEVNMYDEVVELSVEKYPELRDHDIYRYPDYVPIKYRTIVVPLTMLVQLSCDLIKKHFPEYNIKSITDILALRFINILEPTRIKVKITKEAPLTYRLAWENSFFCKINITKEIFKKTLIDKKAWAIPDSEKIENKIDSSNIYNHRWVFHGEKFKGITKVIDTGKKGCITTVKNAGGYSSLLDSCYQSSGVFYYNLYGPNSMVLPMRLEKLELFTDINILEDKTKEFEVRIFVKKIDNTTLIYDVELADKNELIMRTTNFIGKKFESTEHIKALYRYPETIETVLSKPIGDDVYVYERNFDSSWTWILLLNMYLTPEERERYEKMKSLLAKQAFIMGRIALRDGIKIKYMPIKKLLTLHPLEIFVNYDQNGVPNVKGDKLKEENIKVSISHKHKIGVAKIGGEKAVGIDVELLSEMEKIKNATFISSKEELLGAELNEDERIFKAIIWTAKEAYAKYTGEGIRFSITNINITFIDKHSANSKERETYEGIVEGKKFKSVLWEKYAIITWIV